MADGGGYAKKKSLKRGPRFKEGTAGTCVDFVVII